MLNVRAEHTSEAYALVLGHFLVGSGWEVVSPRGQKCREELNARVDIAQPDDRPIVTVDPERNAKIAKYTNAEFDLYARGIDSVVSFARHAPFWLPLANRDGTVNSAYGKIVWYDRTYDQGTMTPWQWAKETLLSDRSTRQAVLLFAQPRHFIRGVRDLVCTCHGWFAERCNKLNLTVVMRSNDVVRGFVYDVPWFCRLLQTMAAEIGSTVGTYTHLAHSLHLYESDVGLARRMVYGNA